MEKVGKEGVITVADGNTLEDELDVVEGMKLGRGYVSPYFVTNQKTQKCELENPLILIHDKKISDMNSLVRILELAVKAFCDLEPIYTFEGTYDINTLVTGREITGIASFKPAASTQQSRLLADPKSRPFEVEVARFPLQMTKSEDVCNLKSCCSSSDFVTRL